MEILNRDISMPSSLVTNGTFGNKHILKKIIQCESKDFLIRLDKHKNINDSLRMYCIPKLDIKNLTFCAHFI